MRFFPLLFVTLVASLLAARGAEATERVEVLVPDGENLQHMSFWVAKAGGFFLAEGLDVQVTVPDSPRGALEPLRQGTARVAVLPPPMCLELIADKVPIVLVANLLASDPINLVVRRSVVEARHIPTSGPVGDRLRAMRGLKVGVAPNPPARLRVLFSSQGLDADHDIAMEIIGGRRQNQAFGAGEVDALYAHTPFLETALIDQDAVLVVNQSAGEVPELAGRQIHALVVSRSFVATSEDTVYRLVRAINAAEREIRLDRPAAVRDLRREFPALDPRKVEKIVELYAPAIPKGPQVSAAGLLQALALFPAARPAPSLTLADLSPFVDSRYADATQRPPATGGTGDGLQTLLQAAGAGMVLLSLLGLLLRARRPVTGPGEPPVTGPGEPPAR
jgi:ABC-type nitrate/sulfonate/bicarbonate transport system substrate-binding protein